MPVPSPDLPAPALARALLQLVDELQVTMFCAKDAAGRYVAVNPAFVQRAGERSRRAVLGRRAEDLFVPELAERYNSQDDRVLAGESLRHELELVRAKRGGSPRWHLTSKLPVYDGAGAVLGLVSLSQDLGEHPEDDAGLGELSQVIAKVRAEVASPPTPAQLAALVGTNPAALTRRLRRVTGLSTSQLVLRTRIDHAAQLLRHTSQPLADIAQATGFYDQAAFSRQFVRLAGETPAQFRRKEQGRRPTGS